MVDVIDHGSTQPRARPAARARGCCVAALCILGLVAFAPGIYAQNEAQVRHLRFVSGRQQGWGADSAVRRLARAGHVRGARRLRTQISGQVLPGEVAKDQLDRCARCQLERGRQSEGRVLA